MATNLTEFLGRLAQDPELLEAFRADKTGTMNEQGVSAEHQEVLLSGDADRIHAAVGREHFENEELLMDDFM